MGQVVVPAPVIAVQSRGEGTSEACPGLRPLLPPARHLHPCYDRLIWAESRNVSWTLVSIGTSPVC